MNSEELRNYFLSKTAFIDVRAPVEFTQGHLPGATNLPILNDEERALIGTTYKKQGRDLAIELGYNLVSGDIKNLRVQKWLEFVSQNPEAVIYCFRGGLRSQITQKWLREAGVVRPLIKGGYKQVRNFLIEEIKKFSESNSLLLLSGKTGSGKTKFLNEVNTFYPTLDLEALAQHRGSAFGAKNIEQPTQINFENQIAVALLGLKSLQKSLLIEDESKLIGSRALPKVFFEKMRLSPVVWIEENLENRVNNVFQDYILDAMLGSKSEEVQDVFLKYKASIYKISKKLGGLRAQEILNLMKASEAQFLDSKNLECNKLWIEKLLVYYYDPLYLDSINRRKVRYAFKGNQAECLNYLKSL